MPKIAIVTDSSATIPQEYIDQYGIYVIPLEVIWDHQTYRDGVDISPKQFYERLSSSTTQPSTSQAPPAMFKQLYEKLFEQGYEVLSIHITGKLSGTMDSAVQACTVFPGAKIELLDSNSTAMGLGFQVLAAAKVAQAGGTLKQCAYAAQMARPETGVIFVVSTLEFLRRGGRIGGATAFLGTALDLKPILELRDGRVEAVERVRTFNKATQRLLDLFSNALKGAKKVHISALHANSLSVAQDLLEAAKERANGIDLGDCIISELSPVIGSHTGPGAIGIAYRIER